MKTKNIWWNRIFHAKAVRANIELKQKLMKLIKLAPELISKIGDVTYTEGNPNSARVNGVTSLLDVLAIHKEAWSDGFQNENIGPCSHGMYRCDSIETMTPDQVYLGNIYGLFTKNISFWEEYKDEGKTGGGYPVYEYLTVYQIVLWQYKGQLSSNIRAIAENAEKELVQLKELGY